MYHYVYRITSLIEGKHYYGLRTSTIEPYLDLGIKYFTSSCNYKFRNDFIKNPNNYKCVIVREFTTRKEAAAFEIFLHNKFNVGLSNKFYNYAKSTKNRCDMSGFKHTSESKNKMSESRKGVEPWNKNLKNPYNSETLAKMSESRKGIEPANKNKKGMWKPSIKNLNNLSNAMKGRILSEQHKQNLRKPKNNTENYSYQKEKVTCPFCNKTGGKPSMIRFHFDNCKER